MLVYPVELKDDDGTVLVEFPDVPEAIMCWFSGNRNFGLLF
jgi:hypothetical protein